MATIDLQNVSFTYSGADEQTISNLSLHVADGEAHALLGASGSGKTTLLNLLSGILAPTDGTVMFDDADVSNLPGRDRRVAQVFQFPVLYEGMNVERNLGFPLRTSSFNRAQIVERVAYIANEMGITNLLSRSIGQLSLFEKQLVAVGKALVRDDVSVVLLDEPLTAVEPRTKWRLRQTLRKVQTDIGVTMIYVTHDQTEALTFADRVSVLADGGILQTGTPDEIYARPNHSFVGHFVGSPGMNFLPGPAFGLDQQDTVGFRPEWATIKGDEGFPATVLRTRASGTRLGEVHGITSLHTQFGEMHVRGALSASKGEAVEVNVGRYLIYRDEMLVGSKDSVQVPV